jgi:hypothetical protein
MRARQRVTRHFSIEAAVAAYERLYLELLTGEKEGGVECQKS